MTFNETCAEFMAIAMTAGTIQEIVDRVAEVVASDQLVPEMVAYLGGAE